MSLAAAANLWTCIGDALVRSPEGQSQDAAPVSSGDGVRSLPDVRHAAPVDSQRGVQAGASAREACVWRKAAEGVGVCGVNMYRGSAGDRGVAVRLVSGREFNVHDRQGGGAPNADRYSPIPVLISQGLAGRLWPEGHGLGRLIYLDPAQSEVGRIIGIVAGDSTRDSDHSGDLEVFLPNAGSSPNDIARAESSRGLWLVMALAIVLFTTASGMFGAATVLVQRHVRATSIRRSFGATAGHIRRHVHGQNALLVALCVPFGSMLAWVANIALVRQYGTPPLSGPTLFGVAIAYIAMGQLAVWRPALEASRISPAKAWR